MFNDVKAAAVSFKPEKFDLDYNTEMLDKTIRKAASKGAQLIVTPEGGLDGYIVNLRRVGRNVLVKPYVR